jgi:hypothetical protein
MMGSIRVLLLLLAISLPVMSARQEAPEPEPIEALPEHLVYLYSNDFDKAPTQAERQLFAGARRWESGRTLKVCMFGGNDVVRTLVSHAASDWNQYSSVKFDFGPLAAGFNCADPSRGHFQVRIGFFGRGYWSAVGNDSETRLEPYAPSMNLEGFNRLYSPSRMSSSAVVAQAKREHIATIRHEFGHALALLHEHQNPALNCHAEIKWDGPGNVFDYLALPPNGWPREIVERNLGFIGQTDPDYVPGESDPKSIMMYSLPAQVFRRGYESPCRVDQSVDLSDKDKRIVAKLYPPLGTPTSPTPSDADLTAAKVRPAAAPATATEAEDIKTRILADLQSDDTFVRRNARARLADLLPKLPPLEATDLVQRAGTGSYRLQLGVAFSINHASPALKLSPQAKLLLADSAKNAKDPTLRTELSKASKR